MPPVTLKLREYSLTVEELVAIGQAVLGESICTADNYIVQDAVIQWLKENKQ